tara:strand:+ start:592 stop:780 length:189 start_codon:yes stop_codon:yes gene_type:complete
MIRYQIYKVLRASSIEELEEQVNTYFDEREYMKLIGGITCIYDKHGNVLKFIQAIHCSIRKL